MTYLPVVFYALGWALIHFLWQGTFLGFMAWASLHAARKQSPELRHGLACGFLALMVFAFLGTTLWGLMQTSQEALLPFRGLLAQVITDEGAQQVGAKLNLQLPGLLTLWGVGVALMSLRLGGGMVWLHAVCLPGSQPVESAWEARLQNLCTDLPEGRRPKLRVSHHVDSLMVLGWIRPVILVPASALAGLDLQALEAILAHELAHVRRRDYLINLLQNLVESLLFFHPAMWWVSRQIRMERELCCDDAAIAHCGDALVYASALAALEALRIPTLNTMHLAPQARGGSLMLRIRRILNAETQAPSLPLLPLALAAVLSLTLFAPRLRAAMVVAPEPEIVEATPDQVEVAYRPAVPAYPADAKSKGIQGTVVVDMTIRPDGTPIAVKAISGPEELRTAAVEYASEWRFKPVMVNGKPVKAHFTLIMPFTLM